MASVSVLASKPRRKSTSPARNSSAKPRIDSAARLFAHRRDLVCSRFRSGAEEPLVILGGIQVAQDRVGSDRHFDRFLAVGAKVGVQSLSGGMSPKGRHVLPADQGWMAAPPRMG